MDTAARARILAFETRGHPHPGQKYKHGWIPVGAVAAESKWRPGHWQTMSAEDARAEAAAKEQAASEAHDVHFGVTSPAGYHEDLGRRLAARAFPPGTRVLANGPYRIVAPSGSYGHGNLDLNNPPPLTPVAHPVSDEVMHQAANELDALIESNPPPKPLDVVFTGEKAPDRANTSAEAIRLHGAWRSHNAMDNGSGFASWFMPAAADPTVSELRYHLAHEYGHALSYQLEHTGAAHGMRDTHKEHLSPYGKQSHMEAYAEAFAEYYLSAGTTDNPAALAYAKKFGWHPPILDDTPPSPARTRVLAALGIEARGHPHPGQKYTHGWVLIGPDALAAAGLRLVDNKKDPILGKVRSKPGPGMTPEEGRALASYREAGFVRVNKSLRKGGGELPPGPAGKTVQTIDGAMSRSHLSHAVSVERGIRSGSPVFGERWNSDLTGTRFVDHGFVSTTADPAIAEDFSHVFIDQTEGGARVALHVPAGTPAIELSGREHESELLLGRGLTFEITSDTGPGPNRRLQMTVVAP